MHLRRVGAWSVWIAAAIAVVGLGLQSTDPDRARSIDLAAGPMVDPLDQPGLVLPSRSHAAPATAAPVDPAASPAPRHQPRPPQSAERPVSPPPKSFSGPKAPPAPPPPQLSRPQNGPAKGIYAVIIGINNYPGTSSDLRAAVNDANDVNEALRKMGVPGDHRMLIRDGQASAGVIRASIDWLAKTAGPDTTAVFFYAGHVRKHGSTESMVGADGGTVSDHEMATRLSGMQARNAWIAIAACYGGGFTEVIRNGRILTGAAPSDQLAYENSGFGRSYLVQYMIREAIIEGRANGTTVEAAFAYAYYAIARDYPNRKPVQYDSAPGNIELRGEGAQPQQQSPPTTSPPKPPSDGGGSGGGSGGSSDDDDGSSCDIAGIVKCGG